MSPESPNPSSVQPNETIANEFKRVLNTHGYPFQEAVLRRIGAAGSRWEAWLPEFPVSIQGHSTRIDIVLTTEERDKFIICECKRANPAIANWCFAKSQLWVPNSDFDGQVYAETLQAPRNGIIRVHYKNLYRSSNIYHIAVEAKTGSKGDGAGFGKGQIEEAAGQVCRGLNGLIDVFYKHGLINEVDNKEKEILFVPMIVTTANLYVTEDDLSLASIESGELGQHHLHVSKDKWLWYRYHQSPALKHEVPVRSGAKDLGEVLFYKYARTIAIVTPEGLQDFLRNRFWLGRG